MGTAGTEGFGPAFNGANVENAGKNEAVRDKNGSNRQPDANSHNKKDHEQIDVRAVAGQLKEGKDVAHVVIDKVVSTEGQKRHVSCVSHGPPNPHPIDAQQKKETHPRRHGDRVQQWLTDGDVAVICHRGQDEGLGKDKETEEEELSHASCVGDGVLLGDKTHQHLGDDGSREAKVYEGQVEQEKIHGDVQGRVEPNQDDQAQVAHHGDHVETQKQKEEGHLEPRLAR